jgi:uncharacterized membrane protein YjjP (DUF1212 family)
MLMSRQLSQGELAAALRVIMRFGVLMLRAGAASFRTQEVMDRCAKALQIDQLESYVTPTGIIASAYSGDEHRTQIMAVKQFGVDLNRLTRLELLSRSLASGVSPMVVHGELDEIEKQGRIYPNWVTIGMVGLACAAFSSIVGGGVMEATAAFFGAALAQTLRMKLIHLRVSPVPLTVMCAAVATCISYGICNVLTPIASVLGLPLTPRFGIVASVLLLVPGVPLVTATIDITRLDLVSGLARLAYALLLLVSIAIGMLLILVWTGLRIV